MVCERGRAVEGKLTRSRKNRYLRVVSGRNVRHFERQIWMKRAKRVERSECRCEMER